MNNEIINLEKINLNDFVKFDSDYRKEFGDDFDFWSKKNQKYYQLVRNAVIKNTGLCSNELVMFLNIRKFDLLTSVNTYTFRLKNLALKQRSL